MRAVAYLRVSTDDQHLGPEAQRASIEAWAERHGHHVASWHVDAGVSGAAPIDKRPALLEALSELEAGSVLVIAKRDRLARDVIVAATIERAAERAGASVESADGVGVGDGPEAELLRRIVDAVAAYERGLIRARTRAALGAKRRRGERLGGIPYGFQDVSGQLEANPAEQAAIERARALRAAGASQQRIAATLEREQYPARGGRWHRTTVARLLARPS